MRKLMWFAIGFTAACAGGAYLKYGVWIALAVVLVLMLILSEFRRQMFCVLLGCAIGLGWFLGFDRIYLAPAQRADGNVQYLDITVTDYSRNGENGQICTGEAKIAGKEYTVQFYINEDISLSPGDRVSGDFELRYTGGGKENTTYHSGNGIFVLCYPRSGSVAFQIVDPGNHHFVKDLHRDILSLVDRIFPADTRSFIRALLLGDTMEMSFEMEWNLKTSGIYHVAAVSGMHVSVLFSLLYFLFWKKRFLLAVFGFPILFLFAAVAGFSPSIVRATVMQSIMIVALLVNREYDPPTALAASILFILADNPVAITSVSFQLSVGCMVGIFLFSARIHNYLLFQTRLGPAKGRNIKSKLIRWFVASVSATLGAISLTTPLSAYYFGSVCILGILTNLLTLWVVSVVFIGVVFACILGAIWMPLGVALAWLVAWPVRYVLWVTDVVAKIPLASVYIDSIYVVLWLILLAVLLIVFVTSKKKYPIVLIACIFASLFGTVMCSYLEPRLDNYRITAIDVGQGQCLLLQNKDKFYMVDCGGDGNEATANTVARLLHSQGIFRLDGLILTHYDADHAGGVENLLEVVSVDTLYLPVDADNKYCKALTDKYMDKISWVNEDLCLYEENITIYLSSETEEHSENGLCILFQPENCDILITGDCSVRGERALMERVALPDLEILVAGHHGSKSSTSWELLDRTRPEIVIISVGEDNYYGHPAIETLERLDVFGCLVYRTDIEGTIIFRG